MLADEIVFSMDGEPYRWRDVIVAAIRWGDWRAVERRARHGAACVAHAEETGDPLPGGALDTAAREFRYDRDLITAQSMEEWLARWELTVSDWSGFISREVHRGRCAGDLEELAARYPLPDDEAAQLALVDAICTGDLERWARALAAHVATHGKAAGASASAQADQGEPVPPPSDLSLIAAVLGTESAALVNSAQRLEQVEDSFGRFCAAQVNDRALRDYVSQRQLDWIQFDCRMLAFPEEGMAAEAALMMREDGERFTGVYRVAHTEPRDARFFLDQIDDRVRDRFIGARPGDLLGPIHLDDEYVVYEIRKKVLPTPDDPAVRQRAEEGLLKVALDRQLDRQVRWHGTLTQ